MTLQQEYARNAPYLNTKIGWFHVTPSNELFLTWFRYADLVSRRVYWTTLPDEDTLTEIKKTISTIRGVQDLPVGSLVLVNLEDDPMKKFLGREHKQSTWVYGRLAGTITKSCMTLVYLDPTESAVVSVSIDRVIPVAFEMIDKYLKKKMPSELSTAVKHLSALLCEQIVTYCREVSIIRHTAK